VIPTGARDAAAPPAGGRRERALLTGRWLELVRFGSVGGVAFLVDMGTYNVLRFGPVDVLHDSPLTARVLAVLLATFVSWLGNRHWTFADRRSHRHARELVLFAAVNLLGTAVMIGTLAVSHYVLGQSGPLADNVANVIGIALGTAVRYAGYRLFVFTGPTALPVALLEVGQDDLRPHVPHPRGPVRSTGDG
jgi:putative flippase GtrA